MSFQGIVIERMVGIHTVGHVRPSINDIETRLSPRQDDEHQRLVESAIKKNQRSNFRLGHHIIAGRVMKMPRNIDWKQENLRQMKHAEEHLGSEDHTARKNWSKEWEENALTVDLQWDLSGHLPVLIFIILKTRTTTYRVSFMPGNQCTEG